MFKTKKNRKILTTILTLLLIIGVSIYAFTTSKEKAVLDTIYEGKSAEQVKREFLEVENYKFEGSPLYTIDTDDYRFDVYRAIDTKDNPLYGFYIIGTNISKYKAEDGKEYLSTGTIDFLLYEKNTDNSLGDKIGDERLTYIGNGDENDTVYAFMPFLPTGEATDFTMIIDSSRAPEAYGLEELDRRNLSSLYDVNSVRGSELLEDSINLEKGFERDYAAAGYGGLNIGKFASTVAIAAVLISGLAVLIYITLEKEIFSKSNKNK